MKFMRLIITAVFLLCSAILPLSVSRAENDDDCLCITSDAVKKYCKAENAGVKKDEFKINQEAIARRDIQRVIERGISADLAKDVDARNATETEDLTVKKLDGTIYKGAETKNIGAATNNYQGILNISNATKINIECLTLKGKEAVVYTNQHFVRYVPDRKDESPHEVITNIIHRETWVFTGQGWKIKYLEELERGNTYLDGKLYNP
jgi:hypothetical protein